MNSDEPALVPQWLQKGGPPGTSGGHNYSSTSQFASRGEAVARPLHRLAYVCQERYSFRTALGPHLRTPPILLLHSADKTRPKRESTVTGGRPSSATARESSFARATREPPQRDRALRDSWQSSLPLGGSSTSSSATYNYRPAPVARSNRGPPERVPSDNSRDSFAASASNSTAGKGVFRTQSGPPLRDREDFGFGSAGGTSNYHDAPALRPGASRGVPLTGIAPSDKVHKHIKSQTASLDRGSPNDAYWHRRFFSFPFFDRDFPSLTARSTASKHVADADAAA